ncbi:MAG: CHAT domain-containing protein, partial [Proteobacteria bacterium]|nr:CHAT domain-containing protein [Pseudomonadota bacterium]
MQHELLVGPDHPELLPCLERVSEIFARADRRTEAEPYYQRLRVMRVKVPTDLLAEQERTLGPDHLEVAATLDRLAGVYDLEGRDDLVEPFYRRSLAIREKALGPDHPDVVASLKRLAGVNRLLRRAEVAEALYRRVAEINARTRGGNDRETLGAVFQQAKAYHSQNRLADAEPLYRQVLAGEAAFAAGDPIPFQALGLLAELYFVQDRFAEAEPLYRRRLAIEEQRGGADDTELAQTLDLLAQVYKGLGRPRDAEPLQMRSARLMIRKLGEDHTGAAAAMIKLATASYAAGNYLETERRRARALVTQEKAFGESGIVARSLNVLAGAYFAQGRSQDAEPLLRRALAMWESLGGAEHADAAQIVGNLGALYLDQGRFIEAAGLVARALDMIAKSRGPDHPDLAHTLDVAAQLHDNAGLTAEAERLYARGLAIRLKALGDDHPDVARTLTGLAVVYAKQGRIDDAERLHVRSIAIHERALGPDHPQTADALHTLASLYARDGRAAHAEALLDRGLRIYETALGADHPRIVTVLRDLARLHQAGGRPAAAIASSRRAVDILARRIGARPDDRAGGSAVEQASHRSYFLQNVALVAAAGEASAAAESFRVAQFAQLSTAGRALAGTAARFAAGSDALAGVVRERQDLTTRWRQLDAALVEDASKPPDQRDVVAVARLREQHAATGVRLDALDARIAAEFPAYAELSNPKPLELAAAQALLAPDEALLVYLATPDETWLWALRRDRAGFHRLAIDETALAAEVTGLRGGLAPEHNPTLKPFDARRAYTLHQTILSPATPLLDGARHVFVVPDGALESLPIGVLVTRPPRAEPASPERHREVAWFARERAVTVLPSVGSLRALRQFSATARSASPFVGIGNPVLEGTPGAARGGVKLTSLFRGAQADVAEVRKLTPLPETADELRAVAKALGAGDDVLYLAERASEPELRRADLARYRVLSFATHGLMSGELKGLAEPALVLTPPRQASPDNDGLLTASKVATLKLNADWVVLSACNTAAADGTPDAGGLSGLAKAFFYAGARSVLVSHWSVPSKATVKLVTG